jgi:hypothetical protein
MDGRDDCEGLSEHEAEVGEHDNEVFDIYEIEPELGEQSGRMECEGKEVWIINGNFSIDFSMIISFSSSHVCFVIHSLVLISVFICFSSPFSFSFSFSFFFCIVPKH